MFVGVVTGQTSGQTQSGTTPPATTQPPPPPASPNAPEMVTKDSPALFKTRVNLVMVPVVIRDAKGNTVGTYTKDNFQLFDKGKLQEIKRFTVEKTGDQAAKAAKALDVIPTEGEPAAPPDIPERFIGYLFDDIHMATGDLIRSRDAASRQIAKLAKTERAAIFTTSGQNQVDFTDDQDKLQSDLLLLRTRSISYSGSMSQCPEMSYYLADMILNRNDSQALNLVTQEVMACAGITQAGPAQAMAMAAAQQALSPGTQETQVSLAVLKDVIRRMSAMPGQRIAILISPGFISPIDLMSEHTDILDRAIKANVILNGIDARGLWTDPTIDASSNARFSTGAFMRLKQQYDRDAALAQEDILAEMAYGTGGQFFHNNNDLEAGMRLLGAAPEYIYLLGFSPQNLKLDGSFHSLKVVLKTLPPVHLDLQARKGYYAPKKLSTAEETAKQEIEEALFSREELSDLPVELHAKFFKGDKDATVSVICRMDAKHIPFRKADGRNYNFLTIVSGMFDRNGNFISGVQKTIDLKLKDATLEKLIASGMSIRTDFTVPPGTYMIRLVVRDTEGQLMSALNGAVQIQ